MDKCIKCHTNDIFSKKRQLCRNCYYLMYRKQEIEPSDKQIQYNKEILFIKNYFKHNNWIYQPAMFHLNNYRYTPDFYDIEKNEFIEVIGTRQAYHENKHKYSLFLKLFPSITLKFFDDSGNEIFENIILENIDNGEKIQWPESTN